MGKLVHLATYKHMYAMGDQIACAQVLYGTKKDPRDHLGNQAFKMNAFTFETHLQNIITPHLNAHLSGSRFQVIGTDLQQGECYPSITIKQRNLAAFTDSDIKELHQLLSKAIRVINAEEVKQKTHLNQHEEPTRRSQMKA